MALDTLQVVDAISDSPNVILDLNNRAPIGLAKGGWNAPPPSLSRSMSRSNSRDGDNVSQSSYTDRTLEARVHLLGITDEQTAEQIQAVARIMNSDGWWLKFQRRDAVEPVFFRCKRADITETVEYNGNTPIKTLTLRIPAEPFAYGLPVTNTVTIANDPTAASNPMSVTLPEIQGDVATSLQITVPVGNGGQTAVIASVAGDDLTGAPYAYALASTPSEGAGTAWDASSNVPSVDSVSGNFRRRVKTATDTGLENRVRIAAIPNTGIKPGDYRVLLRYKCPSVPFAVRIRSTGTSVTLPANNPGRLHWADLGVHSIPFGADPTPDLSGLWPSPVALGSINILVATATTGTLDVDEVLFIPVSTDSFDDVAMSMTYMDRVEASPSLLLDGAAQKAVGISAGAALEWNRTDGPVFTGGFPRVVPGKQNRLTIVRRVLQGQGFTLPSDSKTETYSLTYLYYPRYLYTRPASS